MLFLYTHRILLLTYSEKIINMEIFWCCLSATLIHTPKEQRGSNDEESTYGYSRT